MSSKRNIRKFSLAKRIFSFRYAFKGIIWFLSQQYNLLVHFLAAAVVISAGFYFSITPMEWCVLLLCVGAVIATEMINSAIEILCDAMMPERNRRAEIIKDISAGAVLVAALVAVMVGGIIFVPRIVLLFK